MSGMEVAGIEVGEGSSRGHRQNSALTLTQPGAIAGFWAKEYRT